MALRTIVNLWADTFDEALAMGSEWAERQKSWRNDDSNKKFNFVPEYAYVVYPGLKPTEFTDPEDFYNFLRQHDFAEIATRGDINNESPEGELLLLVLDKVAESEGKSREEVLNSLSILNYKLEKEK